MWVMYLWTKLEKYLCHEMIYINNNWNKVSDVFINDIRQISVSWNDINSW